MSTKITLQVPMDKSLKEAALKAAKKEGFSSLQEVVRVILKRLASNRISFNVADEQFPPEFISTQEEVDLSRKKIALETEIKSGTAFTYDSNKKGNFLKQHQLQVNDRKV